MAIHDFQPSLQRSHDERDDYFWTRFYQNYFPSFKRSKYYPDKSPAQLLGVDTIVTLAVEGGHERTVYIDEKGRDVDYSDIALEYWSAWEYKKPGWVTRDLACDYIAYLIKPTGRVFMMPFRELRRAWSANGDQWIGKYYVAKARNKTYTTISVCVPVPVLYQAISRVLQGE